MATAECDLKWPLTVRPNPPVENDIGGSASCFWFPGPACLTLAVIDWCGTSDDRADVLAGFGA
jgi:hypothetical protein